MRFKKQWEQPLSELKISQLVKLRVKDDAKNALKAGNSVFSPSRVVGGRSREREGGGGP